MFFSGAALSLSVEAMLVKNEQNEVAIVLYVICKLSANVIEIEAVSFDENIRFWVDQNRFGSFADSFRRFRL